MESSHRTIRWLTFFCAWIFSWVIFGILGVFAWFGVEIFAFSLASTFIVILLNDVGDLKDGVEQQKLANSEMLRELSEIREELSDPSKIREDFDLKEIEKRLDFISDSLPDEFRDWHVDYELLEKKAKYNKDLAKIPLKDRFATESDSLPQKAYSDKDPSQDR